jgi:glycosyltransferase involved in cell wall biosynthesis
MVVAGPADTTEPNAPPYLITQVQALRDLGVEVSYGIVDDRTSIHGILRNLTRLKRRVADVNPAVIHAQYASISAYLAALAAGSRPLVVSFWGSDLLGTPAPGLQWRLRERGGRLLGLRAARAASSIIVMSQNLRDALPPDVRPKATILPHGIDMAVFQPLPRSEARRRLNWLVLPRIVLFNASHNEGQYVKNPELARRAVELAQRSFPDAALRMISSASRGEVALMMNAADCLIVTSLHEGSPNIVKEAMACNLPVVSVPCGDVRERLAGTYPGAVCPYEARLLAQALEGVLAAGIRSNGREQLIAQGQTDSVLAEKLVTLYQQTVEISRDSQTANTGGRPTSSKELGTMAVFPR